MEKLSDLLQIGDQVTIYKSRGSNWSAKVLEMDDSDNTAKLDLSKFRGGIVKFQWFAISISEKGVPYAKD